MTDSIKVWVAQSEGAIALIGKNGRLYYITDRNMHKGPDAKHIDRLKSLGWTIKTMTLTHGNKE